MVVETYDESGEWDCPLCPDPVVRLDEVIVLGGGLVAHADCLQRSRPEVVEGIEPPAPVRQPGTVDAA